jgi:hypothetical protein
MVAVATAADAAGAEDEAELELPAPYPPALVPLEHAASPRVATSEIRNQRIECSFEEG